MLGTCFPQPVNHLISTDSMHCKSSCVSKRHGSCITAPPGTADSLAQMRQHTGTARLALFPTNKLSVRMHDSRKINPTFRRVPPAQGCSMAASDLCHTHCEAAQPRLSRRPILGIMIINWCLGGGLAAGGGGGVGGGAQRKFSGWEELCSNNIEAEEKACKIYRQSSSGCHHGPLDTDLVHWWRTGCPEAGIVHVGRSQPAKGFKYQGFSGVAQLDCKRATRPVDSGHFVLPQSH